MEQTRRLQTGFKAYEIGDFITKLRAGLQGVGATDANDIATQDLSSDSYDWLALGRKHVSLFKLTPRADFMYVQIHYRILLTFTVGLDLLALKPSPKLFARR